MAVMSGRRTVRELALGVVVAGVLFGSGVTSAAAATTATVACSSRTVAQKFQKVDGDTRSYFTAPSGSFESGTSGWVLSGAAVGSGNETRYVNGTSNAKSLVISSGGTATAPIFCNQSNEPSLRFFFKGSSGARVRLHIDVTSSTSNSLAPLDWEMPVSANGSWSAANGIDTPLIAGSTSNVQLRFTAVSGTVQVDDIEVDPWRSL
jgi:hypothetical protein